MGRRASLSSLRVMSMLGVPYVAVEDVVRSLDGAADLIDGDKHSEVAVQLRRVADGFRIVLEGSRRG